MDVKGPSTGREREGQIRPARTAKDRVKDKYFLLKITPKPEHEKEKKKSG